MVCWGTGSGGWRPLRFKGLKQFQRFEIEQGRPVDESPGHTLRDNSSFLMRIFESDIYYNQFHMKKNKHKKRLPTEF
jgi:hypothetical protein